MSTHRAHTHVLHVKRKRKSWTNKKHLRFLSTVISNDPHTIHIKWEKQVSRQHHAFTCIYLLFSAKKESRCCVLFLPLNQFIVLVYCFLQYFYEQQESTLWLTNNTTTTNNNSNNNHNNEQCYLFTIILLLPLNRQT